MKALTIRQPWVHAILHLGKRIENRSWAPTFRGVFALHAGKSCREEEYLDALYWMKVQGLLTAPTPPLLSLPRGGVCALARLACLLPREAAHCETADLDGRWKIAGQYGLVITDVRPVPFIACRGDRGFFDLPLDVAAQLTEAAA